MNVIPDIQQPVIDKATGLMNDVWYRYLKQLDAAVRALQAGG